MLGTLNARNVALNAKPKIWWLSTPGMNNDSELQTVNEGSKHRTKYTTLNSKLRRGDGFKRLNVKNGSKLLNVEDSGFERLNVNNGSKCQTMEEWWLWTLKLRRDGGSERHN